MVSPLGVGVKESWRRLINGESGIAKIRSFNVDDLSCKIAGQIPTDGCDQPGVVMRFSPEDYVSARNLGKMDTFVIYAIAAAAEAIADAGVDQLSRDVKERIGVIIGSGIGGLSTIYDTSIAMYKNGARRVSPFFIPSALINLAAGHVSIMFGLKGPNHSVVTACATGTHAVGDAYRMIQMGSADIVVAGGAEAAVCPLGIAGFSAARALSTSRNDTPQEASRPWDKSRDGFVMGEGAGVLVLENLDHAKARGVKSYAEVIGYGMSGDAYHMTAPSPDGDGAFRAMRETLKLANIAPDQIDYINAHGTSTSTGDMVELRAVEQLLGSATKVSMSSTKSAIGHLLGAAGAVEAIFSLMAIKHKVVPPTLNLHDPEKTFLDLTPLHARERKIDIALSNSFGFGGTNASILLRSI
jgi:3-oxoacyl-[acyl-carrier-protein] synthase II